MGPVVDVDIVAREHAILSASSASRWLVCTPSARLEESVEDEASSYASDGTAAHAFAELRLRYLLKQSTKAEYLAAYEATKKLHAEAVGEWNPSDWEAIDSYVKYVMSEAKRLDAEVHVEQRVDYSEYAQGGFGTSDALLVSTSKKTIKSIDLKFGTGVPVDARDNPQAKLYALGGLLNFDPGRRVAQVEWAIVQPRLNYIGEDGTSARELLDWAETVVAPAAKLAWEGKGKLVPTAKGCQFCKVRATCRARVAENVLIARRDFVTTATDPRIEEKLMTMEEVARILPDLDAWISWANQLKAYALEQVRDHGATVPGYKLVRGRSNRSWDPEQDVETMLKAVGVSETDLYSEPSMRSVAQLEKKLGKKKFIELADSLVVRPLGTPALVPDTDPRPAIDPVAEARNEFNKSVANE
jgi:hypothetical protein